jgi:glycosyltransferase involved in cell wall biosynthesis
VRILIDLQGVQSASRYRGIGRYSLSLALAMARNAGKHEIWLALNSTFPESIFSIRHSFEGLVPPERIRVFDIPAPVAEVDLTNEWRTRAAEQIREHFLQQLNPDVVHITSLFEGYLDDAVTSVDALASGLCTAVTLYDLIPLLNQRDYLINDTQWDYYFRKVQSLKNADFLLAISEASRTEAIDVLELLPSQIINISAAADEQFHPLKLTTARINQLQSQYGIDRNMVMYAPGGFDWRKNFEGLFSAYSMLSSTLRTCHQLVIVGNIDADRHGYLQKLAKQAGLAKDEFVITGYISDEELVEFYNMATLFVFPSKHEGFGLPVLEAMACGVPVIGSNVTSIPEVIGLPEALFDPLSSEDMSAKISQALSDKSFRDKLSAHGLNQAKNFTWDASAKRAIVAFEKIVQNKTTVLTSPEELKTISELTQSIAEINTVAKPSDADLLRVAECIVFNTKRGTHKQILLDISELVQRDAKSGIQRVVRSLLREFIENPPQDKEVRPIYFDGTRYKYASIFTQTFMGTPSQDVTDEIVEFCQDDIYLALDLNAGLTFAVHDFHRQLQCRGIKLYFIVYDILLVQHPEWWPEGTSALFEAWLRSISEVATGLACISEAVAEEVRAWIRLNPPERHSGPMVSSFHLGADVENSMPSKGMPKDAQGVLGAINAKPSFLMVGTVEPRKGHVQALAAFELLWGQGVDVNLVIVGKGGWLVDKLINKIRQHPELDQRLYWLEGISDEYLKKVYTASACLIAPSEGEGFGLPLIEAAQHEKPIIARDLPVFREVAGQYAFYFNGVDPESLSVCIINWLTLRAQGKAPQSDNMPWLTWKESALQLKSQLSLNSIQQR